MGVVEGEESVQGQLRSKVVVLARQHLFTHSGTDLGVEVEDRPKSEITTLAALVVFRVLDATTTVEGCHTGVDILVQMKAFLSFADT